MLQGVSVFATIQVALLWPLQSLPSTEPDVLGITQVPVINLLSAACPSL